MRVPRPAAGTMPHISRLRHCERLHCTVEQTLEFARAPVRCMLVKDALARRAADLRDLAIIHIHYSERVIGARREQDLGPRREKLLQSRPWITQDRSAAGC